MDRRGSPRLRDVADAADVSPAIASRVLNADPSVRVREGTRARILSVATSMGYKPHSGARSLRRARTGAVGLVMHGLESPINVDVLAGAQSHFADSGYVTLLADAEQLAESDSQLSSFVARGRLDGVILHSGYGAQDRLIPAIASSAPAVLINSEDGLGLPTVRVDDAAAGSLATEHLLGLGHTSITFIGGAESSQTSDRREDGFRSAMESAGCAASADVVRAGWSSDSGVGAARALVDGGRMPTALVAANAVTASGVLSGLRDLHVSVPDDVSVVAIHDSWFLPHLVAPLTTVRLPLHELGASAARLLIDAIDGREHDSHVFITEPAPQLIVRASTSPPAAHRP